MNEVITIRIVRPHFDEMNEADKKAMVEAMAQDIANQIYRTEDRRTQQENIAFWQNYFLKWHIEDNVRRRDY